MDPRLTSLEVIGLAIRSEEDASKFYGHISKMIANPAVREKYEHLAREEVGHRKKLVDLYRELSRDLDNPPPVPGSPETAEGTAVPEDIAGSLEALLELAVERERKAHEFYSSAARKATDPTGLRVLTELADVELGHEDLLKKELAELRRDRAGYVGSEEPDLVHEGP